MLCGKKKIPEIGPPYAKRCACNMHVTTNYMHVMINMHVGSACNMHVTCMLYEYWSNKHVGSACNMHTICR